MEFKYDKGSGKYIRKNSSIITWFCIERFTNDFLNKTVEILEDNTEEIEEYNGESFEQLGYEVGKMSIAIAKGLEKAIKEMRKDIKNG